MSDERSPAKKKPKKASAEGAAATGRGAPAAAKPAAAPKAKADTSKKVGSAPAKTAAKPRPPEPPPPLTSLSPTQLWLGGVLLTVIGTVVTGFLAGPPSAVLVLLAAAFIAVISLFWSSLRTLLGETPLESADAFAIGAPRVEEEQKRAVLRALKDLEFERGVGKISDEDYRVLVARYREEAKRLLRQLDEAGASNRARAEKIVAERMLEGAAEAEAEDEDEADEDEDEADEEAEADGERDAEESEREAAGAEPAEEKAGAKDEASEREAAGGDESEGDADEEPAAKAKTEKTTESGDAR